MLDEMDQRDILPDVTMFTAIISGLCKGKKVDEAHRLFNTMKVRGRWPDLVCYNVLLNGFCSGVGGGGQGRSGWGPVVGGGGWQGQSSERHRRKEK